MCTEAAIATSSWPVGRWTCTLTIHQPKPGHALHAVIEWSPALPPGALSVPLVRQYRTGRDAAIASLASELGLSVAVVDL